MNDYIQFQQVRKRYGEQEVLHGIDLSISRGEFITLLGPSGCGKSTLLRCLAGLEAVTSGSILLDGEDITGLPPQKRGIGMVFQQYSLFPNMTAAQNIAFGMKIAKIPREKILRRTQQVLEIVGLSNHADHYPCQLSGGQQQRVALARAIVLQPKVLLLDEPLSAIDALLRRNLQMEIRRIQKKLGITTVFVTHDQDEAMTISDRIFLLSSGKVEQMGTPASLYTTPRTSFAANFIGNYNILPAHRFAVLTGTQVDATQVAIRPELITVSQTPPNCTGCYILSGAIHSSQLHGNVIRYKVRCGDDLLQADTLFTQTGILEKNTPVYLSLPTDECIPLKD